MTFITQRHTVTMNARKSDTLPWVLRRYPQCFANGSSCFSLLLLYFLVLLTFLVLDISLTGRFVSGWIQTEYMINDKEYNHSDGSPPEKNGRGSTQPVCSINACTRKEPQYIQKPLLIFHPNSPHSPEKRADMGISA